MDYVINWTPAKLADDGEASVTVSFQQDRHHEPKELFKDYQHTDYKNPAHWKNIARRILSYHMGHEPTQQTVDMFIARPTVSKVIITAKELDKFFGATDRQASLLI